MTCFSSLTYLTTEVLARNCLRSGEQAWCAHGSFIGTY